MDMDSGIDIYIDIKLDVAMDIDINIDVDMGIDMEMDMDIEIIIFTREHPTQMSDLTMRLRRCQFLVYYRFFDLFQTFRFSETLQRLKF